MGDFNLDLFNSDLHSTTNDFVNVGHALFQLIDNIFTNNISASCNNGLIINDLSDHLPIFSLGYSDARSSSIQPQESVTICNFSRQNINAFNNLLCETDWNSLTSKDADAAYDEFLQKCTELYNKSFPPRLCE